MTDKRKRLGQVFSPPGLVERMASLICNSGPVLDPAAGAGAFAHIASGPHDASIEIDPALTSDPRDFFATDPGTFATVIGNPPYVRYADIPEATRALPEFRRLRSNLLDSRANLFLYFIAKCVDNHLDDGGELIFVTPRSMLKSTSAAKLNAHMHATGSFSHWIELGDRDTFVLPGHEASTAVAIWRWVKGTPGLPLADGRTPCVRNGCVSFAKPGTRQHGTFVADAFDVKVGALSGADGLFEHADGAPMVRANGGTRTMLYGMDEPHPSLLPHKDALLRRRAGTFGNGNWWQWARPCCDRPGPRIYVPGRTRKPEPFFVSDVRHYDGSVLALFAKDADADLHDAASRLNATDWNALGYVAAGRLEFTQRSLSNAPFSIQ